MELLQRGATRYIYGLRLKYLAVHDAYNAHESIVNAKFCATMLSMDGEPIDASAEQSSEDKVRCQYLKLVNGAVC